MDERSKKSGVPFMAATYMGAFFATVCLFTASFKEHGVNWQAVDEARAGAVLGILVGMLVAILCQPMVGLLLARKQTSRAVTILMMLVTPFVIVLSLFRLRMLVPSDWMVVIGSSAAFYVFCAGLCLLILPNYYDEPGCCHTCGYDLRGSLKSERCPECGRPFDRDEMSVVRGSDR